MAMWRMLNRRGRGMIDREGRDTANGKHYRSGNRPPGGDGRARASALAGSNFGSHDRRPGFDDGNGNDWSLGQAVYFSLSRRPDGLERGRGAGDRSPFEELYQPPVLAAQPRQLVLLTFRLGDESVDTLTLVSNDRPEIIYGQDSFFDHVYPLLPPAGGCSMAVRYPASAHEQTVKRRLDLSVI